MAGHRGGRTSKLTPDLRDQLMQLIGMGVTVEDACGHVGISKVTFYKWRNESERLCGLADALWERGVGMLIPPEQVILLTFANALTRAHAEAKIVAVGTIRSAMFGVQQVETTRKDYTETRLRRGKDGAQEPYEYRRTETTTTTRNLPGDWRAAEAYLKRRHPDEWGDRMRIDDWRSEAVALIQSGDIVYDALVEEVGEDDATELFITAGVPIPRT